MSLSSFNTSVLFFCQKVVSKASNLRFKSFLTLSFFPASFLFSGVGSFTDFITASLQATVASLLASITPLTLAGYTFGFLPMPGFCLPTTSSSAFLAPSAIFSPKLSISSKSSSLNFPMDSSILFLNASQSVPWLKSHMTPLVDCTLTGRSGPPPMSTVEMTYTWSLSPPYPPYSSTTTFLTNFMSSSVTHT